MEVAVRFDLDGDGFNKLAINKPVEFSVLSRHYEDSYSNADSLTLSSVSYRFYTYVYFVVSGYFL